ncbi:MAG: hypothetical protein ACRCST_03745 [Turicibacter sp.]
MKKITFSEINISGTGFTTVIIEEQNDVINKWPVHFSLNKEIVLHNDLIALSLSTLCGRNNYSEITMDLDVSPYMFDKIKDFTLSGFFVNGLSNGILEYLVMPRDSTTLNFSGGFDSLSALCLMPDNINLVSMDFGGRFGREKAFFAKFDPVVVSTNIIDTPLRSNSWSFMGIGSILTSAHYNTKFNTFGGILEASPNNFDRLPIAAKNVTFPPFSAAGMMNAPYTLGLSEVATMHVIAQAMPDMVSESLDSLAEPGTEKRYRKQVLAEIMTKRHGVPLNIKKLPAPTKQHFTFGQNFAADFLSLYIIKYAGYDIASHTINNIPFEFIEISKKLSLDFYERINTNFYINLPSELKPHFYHKCMSYGLEPYTRNDWEEFILVTRQLSSYYKIAL